jgi:hypothetical protein
MEILLKRIEMRFTRHSQRRMRERGTNPNTIISLLKEVDTHSLVERREGCEIPIPLKGRLVGNLFGNQFIVKTFKFPKFGDYGNARIYSIHISHIFLN